MLLSALAPMAAAQNADEFAVDLIREKDLRRAEGASPMLRGPGTPAVLPYLDAAMTQLKDCAAAFETVTVYLTAEYFVDALDSIQYVLSNYNANFTYVDQSSGVGTIVGDPDGWQTIIFYSPLDASGQVVIAAVRYVTAVGCSPACSACNTGYFITQGSGYGAGGMSIDAAGGMSYPCQSGDPDLYAESLAAPATALVYQDISTVTTLTVRNIGDGASCSIFRARFYLSTDQVITTTDLAIGNVVSSPTDFLSGTTRIIQPPTGSRIPLGAAPGVYYIGAIVDVNMGITELNEGNNIAYQAITIEADPTISKVYCLVEDFQEGTGGWTPVDLTNPGPPQWHQASYGGTNGVMWCGMFYPNDTIIVGGYGDDWAEHLTKQFTLSPGADSLRYRVQYDSEQDFDSTHVMISTDGTNYTTLESLNGVSSGFERRAVDISAYVGSSVWIRFLFRSDGAYSDEDGLYDSDGGCRLDWVKVADNAVDDFTSDACGWTAANMERVGGEFRLVYEPLCEPGYPCEINGMGTPQITCNAWAAYDPVTGDFPFASAENAAIGRNVELAIESPAFAIPAGALGYSLEFDVHTALPLEDYVFFEWYVAAPDGADWRNASYVYYGDHGWFTYKYDVTPYVGAAATTMRVRLVGREMLQWGTSGAHTCAPIFDNVKLYAVVQNQPGSELPEFPRSCIVADEDWDGVGDLTDACPAETGSPFDRDGDGCRDEAIGARHVEYLALDTLAYYVNETGLPFVTDGSDITAIQEGMSAWNAVPDLGIVVANIGTTTQSDAQALDGINIVTCTDPDFVFPTGVLAVGLTTSYVEQTRFDGLHTRPGQIVDCDMIFNPLMQFKTPTQGTGTDLRSVTTHEAGHLLGLSHSGVRTSTMFYVLPPGTEAASLEPDDILVARRAYADSASLAAMSRLKGTVTDGRTGDPVPGAIVFAIDASSGDTLSSEYTLVDGSFDIAGLPDGSYYVSIYPLNGSSTIAYLQPANINDYVLDHAVTLFVPEYYDAAESQNDDPAARVAVTVQAGAATTVPIVTNIDEAGPAVLSSTPAPGAAGVHIDASMLVVFSEPIDLGSVGESFSVRDSISGAAVAGSAALISDDSTLAFIPRENLAFDAVYELRVDTTLADKFGNGLPSAFVIYFRTEAKPDVGISSLAPRKGVTGSIVVVSGYGFEDNPASLVVDFNGVMAPVIEASSTRLVVTVSSLATTGNVTVTNLVQGKTSNALSFTVISAEEVARGFAAGSVSLPAAPRWIDLHPDGAIAFIATEAGYSAVAVDPGAPNYLAIASFAVPEGLSAIAVAPDGQYAYAVGADQAKLYRIKAIPGTGGLSDLVIMNEMETGGTPVGIAIDPAGRRAYVADGDVVQVWDINPRSVTFDREIGRLAGFPGEIRGKLATDPTGARLIALSGSGKAYVHDIAGDTLLAEIPVGYDPRDVAVDPLGERAYVTDGNGFVTIVSLGLLDHVYDISTGGAPRGAAVTPAGSFLYAVNRELNIYDIVDLRSNSPTYRSIVANIPLPNNPVDAAIAPDGLYAFALSEAEKKLAVTAIGVGPTISGLWPPAGPVGTKVVLAGSDLEADAEVLVSFAGATVAPEYRGDSVLVAAVPAGASSGPVTVIGRNPLRVDAPSNEIYFEVLGPSMSNVVRGAGTVAGGGADLGEPLAVSAAGGVAMIPTAGAGGALKLLDVAPGSPTLHQFIGEVALGAGSTVDDILVTPDGRRVFVVDRGAGTAGAPASVPVIDINRLSATFASVLGSIDVSSLTAGLSGLAVSPSGMSCVLAEYDGGGGGRLHLCAIDPASGAAYQILGTVTIAPGAITALAYHPAGRYCYAAVSDPDAAAVYVLDADPESAAFMTIVGSVSVPIDPPRPVPSALVFTPSGSRCLLLTGEIDGGAERRVVMFDTGSPAAPVATTVQSVGGITGGAEHMAISPRGDRLIVSLEGEGILHQRIIMNPDSLVLESAIAAGATVSEAAYRYDASRFYAAVPAADEVRLFDFASADSLTLLSGDGQSGVAGTELAASLRVKVSNAGSAGVGGIPVVFTISDGGGFFAGSGTSVQTALTDALGRTEARWVLGDAIGAQHAEAYAPGLAGSPLAFAATALADPESLPLQLVDVVPEGAMTGVSVNTAILATFSRAVDLATVDSTTFYLRKDGAAAPLAALIGVTGGNRALSITPRAPLDYSTAYRIEVAGTIRDLAGGPIANPSSTLFTTGIAPPPTLFAISPPCGLPGAQVVLGGSGFDARAADNVVLFNDAAAGITEAGDDHLDVVVPTGLTGTSAFVKVQANAQESNMLSFTILTQGSILVDQHVIANVGTGSSTRSVAITPDGAWLYAVSPKGNAVVSIDIRTRVPYPAIPVGENPFAIEIHPFGTLAYVTNYLSNTVSVIDIDRTSETFDQVIETIPVGQNPLDALVTPDGDRLIVSNVGSADLTIVDADDQSMTFNSVLATLSTGSSVRSVAVTPDGGRLYVGTNDGYLVVDVVNFAVVATVGTGSTTKSIAVTPDGALLLLLTTEGAVLFFDIGAGSPTENQVVGQVGTGTSVKSIAVTPDGGMLYFIMELFDAIEVYRLSVDTSAGVRGGAPDEAQTRVHATIVDTLYAGEDPCEMVFGPNGSGIAAVTNAGDLSVSIFDPEYVPIAVMLSLFEARQVDRGALISWTTAVEPGVIGYHVMRAENPEGEYLRITDAPVAARGVGARYSFVDDSVRPSSTYFYKLEVMLGREAREEFGPVEFTYIAAFALRQNVPNPFNPATRISFTIPEACHARLAIYDVSGREVKALVNRLLRADHYQVVWDGTNNRGARVASGIYFYRLEAGRYAATRKMVLLR